MQLTIKNLENCFNGAKKSESKYVGVLVKDKNSSEPELIINPRANYDKKLDYYKKAYNDDLTLKACKDIKIIAFTYATTLLGLECDLFMQK